MSIDDFVVFSTFGFHFLGANINTTLSIILVILQIVFVLVSIILTVVKKIKLNDYNFSDEIEKADQVVDLIDSVKELHEESNKNE